MRTADLALYADVLAAKAARADAALERARNALRQATIERAARVALDPPTRERLERLGALTRCDARRLRIEVVELTADLAALRELQGWAEARLAEAGEPAAPGDTDTDTSFGDELRVSAARSRAADESAR